MTERTVDNDAGEQSRKRGDAGTTSRRTFIKSAASAGAVAAGLGSGVIGSAAAGIPTPWLHRDGNLLKDPSGNKVILRGVNIVDPYRAARDAPHYKRRAETLVEMATDESNGWYSRVIRIPMQPNDIAREGAGSVEPGAFSQSQLDSYLEKYVDPAVDKCEEVGAYCILDYHRHWPDGPRWDDPALSDEVHMFWETVASRYSGRSHILFEVFNEPTEPYAGHEIYDGGPDVTDPESEQTWLDWREAAQPWVDTIKERSPQNIVIIGSPRWSQWTYWAPKHEFEGDNLAYAAHVYTQDGLRPLSKYFGEPSEEVPVFMSEFGWGGSEPQLVGRADEFAPQFRDLFDNYDMHWQAWSFDFDWEPGMLNRDYEVDNGWGEFVKGRLQEMKDQDVPSGDSSETPPSTPTTSPPPHEDDFTAPTVPSNLSVANTTASSATVEWGASTDEGPAGLDHYDVLVNGEQVQEASASATSATVSGVRPNADTPYTIGVRAVDSAGNESDAATVTLDGDPKAMTVGVDLVSDTVSPDGTVEAAITLSEAPAGLAGYTIAVNVEDTSVATVTDASYPDVFGLTDPVDVADDGSSVTLKAVDVQDEITAGDTDVELATVSLSTQSAGETALSVAVEAMDGDDGSLLEPATTAASLSVANSTVDAIEGNMPQDPDGDGHYEDLNGNGRIDADDVVVYFEHKDDAVITDHTAAYDFNGNGRIDFDDVASLFGEI